MDASTYPFPLAAHSSHHSRYHRFLLGADAAVLAPFPKPYCVGALAEPLHRLAGTLTLAGWRRLFHGAIPWVEGFGPEHYEAGAIAPHRPVPRDYRRPLRRFGAFDFVQAADPSFTALALVAGDQRLINRFALLGNEFCTSLETDIFARGAGSADSRWTGRMLSGQFMEPNNRWLMPYLHVHARVLNFTSAEEVPLRLSCLDRSALGRAGFRANRSWLGRQAAVLAELGYGVSEKAADKDGLQVDGVSDRLLAALELPRIAVLRILERIVAGGRQPSSQGLSTEFPPAVVAALFPAPPLDPAHVHAPSPADLDGPCQLPTDPELDLGYGERTPGAAPSPWLARAFAETLVEVGDRLVRQGPSDPAFAHRRTLAQIDHATEGAEPERIRQAALFLGLELDRRAGGRNRDPASVHPGLEPAELAGVNERAQERAWCGRSL